MSADDRTFTVASDDTLVEMISRAQRRLVVIAPALSMLVARALTVRFADLGDIDIRLILDASAEVYRLGSGDPDALEIIRNAARDSMLDLREQPGVRLGIVISDDDMLVFAPISKNIEAGSSNHERPNAILLGGAPAAQIAAAAGATTDEKAPPPEIGRQALKPEQVEAMVQDLKRNPPIKFDITRRLNVFSSRVVFIEFEMKNSSLARKQVRLPAEFGVVSQKDLKDRISSRINAPFETLGKIEVEIANGAKVEKLAIDEKWLNEERKRIADEYTFQINNFGRVILREDRAHFDAAVHKFKKVVEEYQSKVRAAISKDRNGFEQQFVDEFAARWIADPPSYLTRWGRIPDRETILDELRQRAGEVFEDMIDFKPPAVRLVEKNISPRNVEDPAFLGPLREIMMKRRVPKETIETLFASCDAAPTADTLLF
jgi:hypothetical protein